MGVLLYHKYFEWENILRIDVTMHACTSIVCYCVKVFLCVCVCVCIGQVSQLKYFCCGQEHLAL